MEVGHPLGPLAVLAGYVDEPDHPGAVALLIGRPGLLELVLGQDDALVHQVPGDRISQRHRRVAEARLGEDHPSRPFDHLALLGQDRRGESGHPFLVDPGLDGHLIDGMTGPQPRLHLARSQTALRPGWLGNLEGQPRLAGLPGSLPRRAVAEGNGFLDALQQALVDDDHEPARLGAFARAEDEPLMIRRDAVRRSDLAGERSTPGQRVRGPRRPR